MFLVLGLGLRFELHRVVLILFFLKKSVLKSECSSSVKTQSEQWEQIYLWPWPRSEDYLQGTVENSVSLSQQNACHAQQGLAARV